MERDRDSDEFRRLREIMARLRSECPWDREQTNESLRKLTIEETFELADAIIDQRDDDIKRELGDLLLHIVFYSLIAEEKGAFDLHDVIRGINEKLIYRHPHVFGNRTVSDSDEVVKNWEKLKMDENREYKPVLSGVPRTMPSLTKATRIQEKARGVGFDWEETGQVIDKVREELRELTEAIGSKEADSIESEFGDLLFSVVNAARLYGVDPDSALEKTNRKFIKRFNYLENESRKSGRTLQQMTLDEMDAIWQEAKKLEREG